MSITTINNNNDSKKAVAIVLDFMSELHEELEVICGMKLETLNREMYCFKISQKMMLKINKVEDNLEIKIDDYISEEFAIKEIIITNIDAELEVAQSLLELCSKITNKQEGIETLKETVKNILK